MNETHKIGFKTLIMQYILKIILNFNTFYYPAIMDLILISTETMDLEKYFF